MTKKWNVSLSSVPLIETDISDFLTLTNFYKLYRWNSDLRRIITEKINNIDKNWYKFIDNQDNEVLYNADDLVYWNNTFNEFITRIIKELEIFWNVYIEKVRNINWWIASFDILDARTISILWNKYWDVIWYKQTIDWNTVDFSPDEIIHIKDMVDLDNPFFWISQLESIMAEILGDKEASLSNYAFFKNNWIPSQLIILEDEKEDDITEEDENDTYIDDVELLANQLKRNFSWWKNNNKFLIANHIKDIKQIWTSNKDMEFNEYRKFTTERLCALMWVPKIVLNYTEGVNYSNATEQFKKFYQDTIIPLQRKIENIINILLDNLGLYNVRFKFNRDINIDKDRIEAITKLVSNWLMPLNEWRKILWLETVNEEYADKLILNKNSMLLEDIDINLTPNNSDNNE